MRRESRTGSFCALHADVVVAAEALTVRRGSHTALAGVDVALARGTVAALVGPNGSGKSSFLHAIAGLVEPVSGTVRVLGQPPGAVRRRIAYVLQRTRLNAVLPVSVREVVAMGTWRRDGSRAERRRAVDNALQALEISALADRHLPDLSGGQRQRVLVAQGLAQGADVLLLDEPLTGVDLVSADRIRTAVAAERARGCTVVFATHDLAEAEQADVVVLLAGRVVAAGAPAEVITPEHLGAAYGVRTLDSGAVLLDDPGHHHWD
jgi:ABC-type Mn2+/Zn2+ transport system ATPase subunit